MGSEFSTWILIVGSVWILYSWYCAIYSTTNDADDVIMEGFQAWSKSRADKKARTGHSCGVLDRFPDDWVGAMIEIVEDSCEDGLPHTTDGATIRIPQSMWLHASPEARETTLRHERIHLDQRRRPEAWATFYRDAWGYTSISPTPPTSIPAEVLETVRGNPDTWPARWAIWRGRYCFVPTYTDLHAPRIRNAESRVWDLSLAKWVPRPPEWEAFFCQGGGGSYGRCVYQSEHPAEISAEMGASPDIWGSSTAAGISLENFMRSSKLLPEK